MHIEGSFEGRKGWVMEDVRGGGIELESTEGSENGELDGQGRRVVGE